ncbi:MAG: hypothetical protein IJJ26_06110, partial [Victivallales bacterium]|nr:hypothetical protein [Victivallales bacterium]
GMKTEGETERKVSINYLNAAIETPNILLADDVLDQGFTLAAVKSQLEKEHPGATVKTTVLLQKRLENPSPEVRALRERFRPDYIGFEVEDRWIVGYGLDVDELFRELPYVALAREEAFR